MRNATFRVNLPPKLVTPLVLSAPHGGRQLTNSLLDHSQLSQTQLLATSDLHTDCLVSFRDDWNWISASYARVVVDLNRKDTLFDPIVVSGAPMNSSLYVKAGYGVIPRFAARGKLLRTGKLSQEEAKALIDRYYEPFHRQLRLILAQTKQKFGEFVLLDIHSAPNDSMNSADIVLGTNFGRSISAGKLAGIEGVIKRHFASVQIDRPYSGGFITQNYGIHADRNHVLQIEVNRNLIEDQNRELRQDFFKKWGVVLDEISHFVGRASQTSLAAE